MVEKFSQKDSNIVALFSSQESDLATAAPVSRFEHVNEQGFAYVQRNGAARKKRTDAAACSFDYGLSLIHI